MLVGTKMQMDTRYSQEKKATGLENFLDRNQFLGQFFTQKTYDSKY